MKKLAPLFPLLFLSSCIDSSQDAIPFNTGKFSLDLKPGDNRLYVREFKTSNASDSADIFSLGLFTIVKDTVFNGNTGRIVEESFWELHPDTTYIWQARELLVQEDSNLSLYYFKGGPYSPFLVGLFKSAAVDTTVFSDRMIVARYPLKSNQAWPIRLADDMTGSTALEKEYLGLQTLDVMGKRYECGAFVLHSFADIEVKSWVASIGLVKAEIDYGDKLQSTDGSESWSKERYDLIGMNVADSTVEKFKATYKLRTWSVVSLPDTAQ